MAVKEIRHDNAGLAGMKFSDGGLKQHVTYTWYRGEVCNYGPHLAHLEDAAGYEKYFLEGLVPPAQIVDHNTRVTAFGSCFAANVSRWLSKRHYNILNSADKKSSAYIVRIGEGMVTSYAIRQQIEWAFEGVEPKVSVWHGYDATAFGYDPTVRDETLQIFNDTDVFVLTFGLSEVWYDKPTGEVFWRAVPQDQFDAERHGFRTVSMDENYENIKALLSVIRKHKPNAKVIMTLSPIPLVATFRNMPCMVSNSVSKASLRLALDKILASKEFEGMAYYWPSYEIVLDGFLKKWKADRRHVKSQILDFIMTLFEKAWCVGGVTDVQLTQALLKAKVADGSMKLTTFRMLENGTQEQKTAVVDRLAAAGYKRFAAAGKLIAGV